MTAPVRTTGWPSVTKVLVHAIADQFECFAATRFPGDLQDMVKAGTGVVRIVRLGGSRDRLTDRSRVAVDVVHATEAQAEDLSEAIAAWLADTRPIRAAGTMLDGLDDVEVVPHELPYPDPTVSQFSATYVVSSRRMETR